VVLNLRSSLQLDFAVDIGLDIVDVALQPAEQMAHGARHARQALGPMTMSATTAITIKLGESDVKHGG